MTSALDTFEVVGDLRAAAARTAARLAPGNGLPHPRDLALLAECEPLSAPPVWNDAAAHVLAAQLTARARQDALALGSGLVDRFFDDVRLTRPASMSAGARSLLYSSVAEYTCSLALADVASRFADEAMLFADTAGLRYRALATGAFAAGLDGDVDKTEELLRRADELFRAQGWPPTERMLVTFFARITVAAARTDAAALEQIAIDLRATQPGDGFWDFTAGMADVIARLFRGDITSALAGSAHLLHSSGIHSSWRGCRLHVVCMHADLLVACGRLDEALALLAPWQSPEGHGVCFPTHRATVLLHLRRDRELIAETDLCAADEAGHNPRTLTPLLVRRALAFQRLGAHRRALRCMEAVILLTERIGASAVPFLSLPLDEVRLLLDAVTAERASARPVVDEILSLLDHAVPAVADGFENALALGLTPTERALASALQSPSSLAEIARERGVSVNTVRSQVRSIYVKLGVNGRAEAVRLLTSSPSTGR
ncbi:helix-turn-helix transcriptional regulator [Microbacterium sp. NPDC090007]|uniref:helix-turn-helix transcriptional regulator n=1 Tax=Microbacterium sp. NPDC090007 TaxID=3364204 RepID=UPI00380F5CA5